MASLYLKPAHIHPSSANARAAATVLYWPRRRAAYLRVKHLCRRKRVPQQRLLLWIRRLLLWPRCGRCRPVPCRHPCRYSCRHPYRHHADTTAAAATAVASAERPAHIPQQAPLHPSLDHHLRTTKRRARHSMPKNGAIPRPTSPTRSLA